MNLRRKVVGSYRGRGRGVPVRGYSRTPRVHEKEWQGIGKLPLPVPESALHPAIATQLTERGFTCWRDVSFLGSWIDIYGRREDGLTVAVEVKVTDWRRGLLQATRIRNAAHEVFLGIWAPYVHRCLQPSVLRELTLLGIGLLSVNGDCEVKLPGRHRAPRYQDYVILPARPSHRAR